MDSLQNLQMQWAKNVVYTLDKGAVDALMHRFGVLAMGTASNSAYDDIGSLETGKTNMLSSLCIRKIVNTFLIMYRHMHCWECKVNVLEEAEEGFDCGIKIHHILASADDFSKLSMHWDLIPSARLTYIHDFRGLYNCVSQVRSACCLVVANQTV